MAYQNFNVIFEFLGQITLRCIHEYFQIVLITLRKHTKHADFKLRVQYPHKLQSPIHLLTPLQFSSPACFIQAALTIMSAIIFISNSIISRAHHHHHLSLLGNQNRAAIRYERPGGGGVHLTSFLVGMFGAEHQNGGVLILYFWGKVSLKELKIQNFLCLCTEI